MKFDLQHSHNSRNPSGSAEGGREATVGNCALLTFTVVIACAGFIGLKCYHENALRTAAATAKAEELTCESTRLYLAQMDAIADKTTDPEGYRLLARAFVHLME